MAKKIIKAIYGSIALLKAYCPICKSYSFIQNGIFVCCDRPYENIPEKEVLKREAEGESQRSKIPVKLKKKILEEQGYKCIYCNKRLDGYIWDEKRSKMRKVRVHFDHFVAWVYSRDNKADNIYASCDICNSIKSDFYFQDLISAREYILSVRKQKKYIDFSSENLSLDNVSTSNA